MRGASYELVAGDLVLSPFDVLRLVSRVPGVTPHQHLVRSRWGCVAEQGVCPGDTLDTCQATAARAGWRRKAPGVSTI